MGNNDLILPGVFLLALFSLGKSQPGGVFATLATVSESSPGGVLGANSFTVPEDEEEEEEEKTTWKNDPTGFGDYTKPDPGGTFDDIVETVTKVIETVITEPVKIVTAKGGVLGSYLSEGYFMKLDPGLGEATPYSKQAEGTLRFGLPEGEYR